MSAARRALALLLLPLVCACAARTSQRPPDVADTSGRAAPAQTRTETPPQDRAPAPPPVASIPPAVVPSPPPPSAPPAPAPGEKAYAAGASALGEGQYEKALDLFAAAWKENPGYPGVTRDFPDALSALKKSGDEAFQKGKLEEAGKRWTGVLAYLSHPAAKGKSLPFGRSDVQGSIDRLSSTLMEKGLVEYRQGNLEAAIAWWKTILAYDPNHAEAAKSVRTASTQLENLKKIKQPK